MPMTAMVTASTDATMTIRRPARLGLYSFIEPNSQSIP